MVSRFDEGLHLMDPGKHAPVAGLRAGPCGRGPVDDRSTVLSMQVAVFQRTSHGLAVAWGRSGEDARSETEKPPYEGKPAGDGRWMIRMGLAPDSCEFSVGAPATAVATALVRNGAGGLELEQWSQQVALFTEHPGGGNDGHDGHDGHDHDH